MPDLQLPILYQDTHFVAINKPNGLLVHRTKIAKYETEFALQKLRDQIEQKVFPIHRLDRKTSGVLLFGLSSEAAKAGQQLIENQSITKKYLAIVRGYFTEVVDLDYDLTTEQGKKQSSQTLFKPLMKTEIPIPSHKFPTSRYSLIEAYPKTGRQHQIRKHLAHLRHYIIGDRKHGDNTQNKLFDAHFQMTTMMLHASEMTFKHPFSNEEILIFAPLNSEFKRMKKVLNL